MARYAIIDGRVVGNIVLAEADFAAQNGWISAPDHVGPGWTWDGAGFEPPVIERGPLGEAKAGLKAEVNALRDLYQVGPAPSPKGAVQSDLASQAKINGAVLMAVLASQAGQPFSVAWTMANNSNVLHNAAEVIAMGQAVGLYVAACHAHGGAVKAAIDAAGDFAALDAIDINVGWPE